MGCYFHGAEECLQAGVSSHQGASRHTDDAALTAGDGFTSPQVFQSTAPHADGITHTHGFKEVVFCAPRHLGHLGSSDHSGYGCSEDVDKLAKGGAVLQVIASHGVDRGFTSADQDGVPDAECDVPNDVGSLRDRAGEEPVDVNLP